MSHLSSYSLYFPSLSILRLSSILFSPLSSRKPFHFLFKFSSHTALNWFPEFKLQTTFSATSKRFSTWMYVQANKPDRYMMDRLLKMQCLSAVLLQTKHKITGTRKNAHATEKNSLRKIASCLYLVLPVCTEDFPSLIATFAYSVKQWFLFGWRLVLLRIGLCSSETFRDVGYRGGENTIHRLLWRA